MSFPSDDFQNQFKFGSAYDLAQKIGESGITKLLKVICDAYVILSNNNIIQSGMTEDEITEELFTQGQCVLQKSSIPTTLVLVNQKIDRTLAKNKGRLPAIDFCFRDRWVKETFFGFECKLLAEGNGTLSREYVDEGLCRYLEGKYSSFGSSGSMIGYVKTGNLAPIIQDVKRRVDEKEAISPMTLALAIGSVKEHYVSIHSRERGLTNFSIHHLFFKFAMQMTNN